MTADRKKPGAAFWATVVVVVGLVGYPLSMGPACGLASRYGQHNRLFVGTYKPLARLYSACPWRVQMPLRRYVEFWLPPEVEFEPLGDWFFFWDKR